MADEQDGSRDQSSDASGKVSPLSHHPPRPGRGKSLYGLTPPNPDILLEDVEENQISDEREDGENQSRGDLVLSQAGTSQGSGKPRK